MIYTDALKKKIHELENMADELMQSGIAILKAAGTGSILILYFVPQLGHDNSLKDFQNKTIRKYHEWYSASLYLVREYAPDRLKDFKKYYSHTREGKIYGV